MVCCTFQRYSFDEGGVHAVVLSSEHDWRNGSRQYTWLENDLKAVDRSNTPWIVLATHRMMYTTQLNETVGESAHRSTMLTML